MRINYKANGALTIGYWMKLLYFVYIETKNYKQAYLCLINYTQIQKRKQNNLPINQANKNKK